MAFSGVHVVCAFAGIDGYGESVPSIIKNALWSEAPSTGVTTTNAAPRDGVDGQAVFRVTAAADSYVSIGQSPDSSASPRHLVLAGQPYDFGVKPGDKLQWMAA